MRTHQQTKNHLKVCVEAEHLILLAHTDTRLGILSHTFFKEVGLALETNHLHPL
ncbi:hypothetical protein ACHAWC_001839, partial [Mediolabrus comicus]